MVLDSNIIIYAAEPSNAFLKDFLKGEVYISAITQVEVLGYHDLNPVDEDQFKLIFKATEIVPVNQDVIEKTIELRKVKRISLGDSIIAATALLNNASLLTRNTKDFSHIPGLQLINPFET